MVLKAAIVVLILVVVDILIITERPRSIRICGVTLILILLEDDLVKFITIDNATRLEES